MAMSRPGSLADQGGLTAVLGSRWRRAGKFPLWTECGAGFLGSGDCAQGEEHERHCRAHREPVFGGPPSDTLVLRRLVLADLAAPDKVVRVGCTFLGVG